MSARWYTGIRPPVDAEIAALADGMTCWQEDCCGWSGEYYYEVDTCRAVVVCSCGRTRRYGAIIEEGNNG